MTFVRLSWNPQLTIYISRRQYCLLVCCLDHDCNGMSGWRLAARMMETLVVNDSQEFISSCAYQFITRASEIFPRVNGKTWPGKCRKFECPQVLGSPVFWPSSHFLVFSIPSLRVLYDFSFFFILLIFFASLPYLLLSIIFYFFLFS